MNRRTRHRRRQTPRRLWCGLTALLLAAGPLSCHLVFPFDHPDVERDAAADAAGGELGLPADLRAERGPADGAGEQDLPPRPCVSAVDANTLALYTFEDSTMLCRDLVGKHHGSVVGKLAATAGRTACGQALAIPAATSNAATDYGLIPHHAAWDTVGAVELWVRFDGPLPASDVGILSRDALGTATPGHFGLYRLCDGAIYLRLQHPTGIAYHCSSAVPGKTWIHIGVNVGAPAVQLFVDGKLAVPRAEVTCGGTAYPCTAKGSGTVAGNTNPWVLGASSGKSAEGKAGPLHHQMTGAVDSLRLSSSRRAFAAP